MRRWAFALGGLLVWALHFVGIYVIASLADLIARADAAPWRLGLLAFGGLCLAVELGLIAWGVRRLRESDATSRFLDRLAVLGAALGGLAIVWQTLPALIGY